LQEKPFERGPKKDKKGLFHSFLSFDHQVREGKGEKSAKISWWFLHRERSGKEGVQLVVPKKSLPEAGRKNHQLDVAI